ncbi:YjbH domain-containing protein [Thalassotalea sp. ND16A]|uniref:YjbH domain-containing protein n=1 Tax=Thalassotalea sp. ND16A TaxID=1535422 RepID=UPI0013646AB6|nr:YjbH domain-containing protein [Thalassotalea sp. ND16A]
MKPINPFLSTPIAIGACFFSLCCVASSDFAADTSVVDSYSMQAYTGVFNTPTANVIDYGDFGFSYSDNYADRSTLFLNQPGFVTANDMKFGVGLLPNVEVVGRLATRTWDCNHYVEDDCGFRDLSASFKWKIPFIPQKWFSLAVGGQDIAGAAVFSEAYYVSASKEFNFSSFGAVRTSVGLSSSDNTIGYMNGAFGSVEYQPFEYLQVAAEYDANAVNVGVKAFAPDTWLPDGWDAYVSAQLYSSDDARNEREQWFNFGVSIPLGAGAYVGGGSVTGGSAARNDARLKPRQPDARLKPRQPGEVGVETLVSRDDGGSAAEGSAARNYARLKPRQPDGKLKLRGDALKDFAAYLVDYGFESVSVGTRSEELGSGVVVRFENNLFNRDEREAVAVVSDLVLARLGVDAVVELTNFGVVVDSNFVTGTGNEERGTRNYGPVNEKPGDDGLTGLFSGLFGDDDVTWAVNDSGSAHFVPRLILSPALYSLVGTEYGAFDYQLVLSSNLQMSLWDGAVIDIRHLSDTVANSDDFADGSFFKRQYGTQQGIDRRLFHQTFALPYNAFTKFSYGRIYGNSDGLLNESRWASRENTHRVSLLVGDFEDTRVNWAGKKTYHKPKLLKYRYRYQPLNWDIELTAGEYWQGDKGFTLRSLHWFGNTQIGLRYRKTKFDDSDGGEEEDFVAIGFSIPLNFGKSMKSDLGFQVRGIEQWNYYVETNLESEGTANTIKTGFGKEPLLYHNLNQAYFNRDRN